MPTVLRIGPYRIYFVSHDVYERPHVHIDRDDHSAKFWLAPVALASNLGFTTVELRRVHRLVVEHESRLLEAWNEYSGAAPGRACEGREVYRRRPGRRSAGRSHHLSTTRVVSPPSVCDSRATGELARSRRRIRYPLAGCRRRPDHGGSAAWRPGATGFRTDRSGSGRLVDAMKARQGGRIGQIFADGRQIDEALRLAARDAIRMHELHDAPVVIWRNGRDTP